MKLKGQIILVISFEFQNGQDSIEMQSDGDKSTAVCKR